jgi:hypothetical protein
VRMEARLPVLESSAPPNQPQPTSKLEVNFKFPLTAFSWKSVEATG